MGKSIVYEVRSRNDVFDFVVSKDGRIIEAIPVSVERHYVGRQYRDVIHSMRRSDPEVHSKFVAVFS